MMIDYCSIGKRIKLTRIKQGVLQKDLAEKIGISKPHMSNIETALILKLDWRHWLP